MRSGSLNLEVRGRSGANSSPALPIAMGKRRRLGVRLVFALGIAVNLLVCLPFVFDPFGMLGTTLAEGADSRDGGEVVVFLADGHDSRELKRFFAENPGLEPAHRGDLLRTLLVRISGPLQPALERLKAQPFAALVMPNATVLCR